MQPPDPFVKRHIDRFPADARVLDLAAGSGRHTALALALGHSVVALDRDVSGLLELPQTEDFSVVEADVEGNGWPLDGETFDGIIVCNYLWRPLFEMVRQSLAPGGVLIWTTFAAGNEAFGRPRNPDFLLRRNELASVMSSDLEIIAFFDDVLPGPPQSARQGICARRPGVDRGRPE